MTAAGPGTHSSPTDQAQRDLAVDPSRSVICQAPAGSGKTTLLTTRYLRLLEIVERPEEILAITFTRKAASEMRQRILDALTDPDDPLAQRVLARGRALDWNLPEQANRLRVQTIDSFAIELIRALPLSSGQRPGSRLEERPIAAYREALTRVLRRLENANDPLADDIAGLFADFDSRYEQTIALAIEMLGRRDQWLDPLLASFGSAQSLRDSLEVGLAGLQDQVTGDLLAVLDPTELDELTELGSLAAGHLGYAWPSTGLPVEPQGWAQLSAMFATANGQLRKRLTTKQGFPPGPDHAVLKQRASTLLDSWRTRGLQDLFEAACRLPVIPAGTDVEAPLRRLAALLSLATLELQEVFDRQGIIDFTELTLAARRALGTDEEPSDLALVLDYRIHHLLIDEFQDTSISQFRLFRQLVTGWQPDDGRTFFAVGDPMQSVYRFRDADVSVYMDVIRNGIGDIRPDLVRLRTNFRSSAELVTWTNATFGPAFGPIDDPVLGRIAFADATAARSDPSQQACRFQVFDSRDAEAASIAEEVAEQVALMEANGDPAASLALLVRSRLQLGPILPELVRRDVRWQGADIDPLASSAAVMDLLSLLRALHDPYASLAWVALLRSPLIGLTLADLHHLAHLAAHLGTAPGACILGGLDPIHRAGLSDDACQRLDRVIPLLDGARANLGIAATRRWLEGLWLRLGGVDAYPQDHDQQAAQRLFELLEERFNRTVDFEALHAAVGDLYASETTDLERPNMLQIMTIHKAKGLEFDHVFLPGLERSVYGGDAPMLRWRAIQGGALMGTPDSEIYQWLQYEDGQREHNEQLRLLYVACTRARNRLHLSCVAAHDNDSPQHLRRPGRGSLIHPIWPSLVSTAEPNRDPDPGAEVDDNTVTPVVPAREDASASPGNLVRLLADYRWTAPGDWPDIQYTDPLPGQTAPRPSLHSHPSHPSQPGKTQRTEVAIGTVIHAVLDRLGRKPHPGNIQTYVQEQTAEWSRHLKDLGIGTGAGDLTDCLAEVTTQVETVLGDETGRWLLSDHEAAASELPLTGIVDGVVHNVVIDRTFVDDHGARWIVDFKSSRPQPDRSLDEFLKDQRANHASQLRRYQRVVAGWEERPIRAALYFTAIAHLEELPGPDRLDPPGPVS